jgi:hypothetical protein
MFSTRLSSVLNMCSNFPLCHKQHEIYFRVLRNSRYLGDKLNRCVTGNNLKKLINLYSIIYGSYRLNWHELYFVTGERYLGIHLVGFLRPRPLYPWERTVVPIGNRLAGSPFERCWEEKLYPSGNRTPIPSSSLHSLANILSEA